MARTRNQGSKWIRRNKRLAIYFRDGCACVFCGVTFEDGVVMTLDHLLACELGGSNHETNLVTACLSCNSSKRDLPMADWFIVLRDCGVETAGIATFIATTTKRDLGPFKVAANKIIASR